MFVVSPAKIALLCLKQPGAVPKVVPTFCSLEKQGNHKKHLEILEGFNFGKSNRKLKTRCAIDWLRVRRYFRQDLDKKWQYWISFCNSAHVDILWWHQLTGRHTSSTVNGDLPACFDPSAASASSPLIRSDNCEALSRPPHRPAAGCWSAACRWHLRYSWLFPVEVRVRE